MARPCSEDRTASLSSAVTWSECSWPSTRGWAHSLPITHLSPSRQASCFTGKGGGPCEPLSRSFQPKLPEDSTRPCAQTPRRPASARDTAGRPRRHVGGRKPVSEAPSASGLARPVPPGHRPLQYWPHYKPQGTHPVARRGVEVVQPGGSPS